MPPDRLSLVFSALSDPTRRAILARLAAGEASVTELAAPFAMSLPAVSKHLKVLERAGLIARGREAQWRPCRLEAAPLREVATWLDAYRQHWDEQFDRLDTYLAEIQQQERERDVDDSSHQPVPQGQELVITRTFDAPRELVFKAFSEIERLAQWWGPKGCAIQVSKLEFRPGGTFHYRMDFPGYPEMWGRFTYREIVPPEKIVWVNAFSDPDGNLTRAPFGETIPLEILNSVTLAEQDGKTVLTLHSSPLDATAEEVATFVGMFDSMQQGWGGTWDQLDAYLAQERAAA